MTDAKPAPKRKPAKKRRRKGAPAIGRPTKCTPALIAAICEQVRTGLPVHLACAAEGVDSKDLSRWREAGAAGKQPFAAFCREVARAEAAGKAALFTEVRTQQTPSEMGPVKDWKARMRLLESVAREDFAPSTELVVKAEAKANGAVLAAARECLPAEWYAVLLSKLAGLEPDEVAEQTH